MTYFIIWICCHVGGLLVQYRDFDQTKLDFMKKRYFGLLSFNWQNIFKVEFLDIVAF